MAVGGGNYLKKKQKLNDNATELDIGVACVKRKLCGVKEYKEMANGTTI